MASLSLHQLMEKLENQQVYCGFILRGRVVENGKIPLDSLRNDGCVETFRRNTKYMEQMVSVLHRSIGAETDMKHNTVQLHSSRSWLSGSPIIQIGLANPACT